jgi:hypothetical protein
MPWFVNTLVRVYYAIVQTNTTNKQIKTKDGLRKVNMNALVRVYYAIVICWHAGCAVTAFVTAYQTWREVRGLY